ncbi:MAG: hypothetical protein OXR66_00445 [Candidatus Woesearchaeota archaeon]|nr:hypothetical protein [Candidatus Woesearchaeota archaeon]
MRKGQAAMEFLMTYGWAILVVLAAIGALAYFGVLSPDKFLPSKCTMNPPFSCTEFKVTTSELQLGITNNAGVDLAAGANVTADCDASGVTTAGVTTNGDKLTGANFNLTGCTGAAVGDRFKADITISYTKSGESVSHTSTGTVQARVEA